MQNLLKEFLTQEGCYYVYRALVFALAPPEQPHTDDYIELWLNEYQFTESAMVVYTKPLLDASPPPLIEHLKQARIDRWVELISPGPRILESFCSLYIRFFGSISGAVEVLRPRGMAQAFLSGMKIDTMQGYAANVRSGCVPYGPVYKKWQQIVVDLEELKSHLLTRFKGENKDI